MIIDLNKTYKTRDGRPVRIYCVDGGGNYPVHGAYEQNDRWFMETWTSKGFYGDSDEEHQLDLIGVGPWDNLQVDDKVILKKKITGTNYHYHFAGINEMGEPMVFGDYTSSWTTSGIRLTIDLTEYDLIIP